MNNLQRLFETDLAFASIVDEVAAAAIGSTSSDFAHEWLKMDAVDMGKAGEKAIAASSGEYVVPIEDTMAFAFDPPGYVKEHIGKLQAELETTKGAKEGLSVALQESIDERNALRNTNAELSRQLGRANANADWLAEQADVLRADLYESRAEVERYRELFGRALDCADEIVQLGLDIDGGAA